MGVGALECLTISYLIYRAYDKLLSDIYQAKSQKNWSYIYSVQCKPLVAYHHGRPQPFDHMGCNSIVVQWPNTNLTVNTSIMDNDICQLITV
eukprot:14824885-Ditylum_brightwellii.AAC.1